MKVVCLSRVKPTKMEKSETRIESIEQGLACQIEEEMNQAADSAKWGKPASDIITRIESIESAKPVRAIWEMVQNARDVSRDGGTDIEFVLTDKEFVFRHNGLPFTPKSLCALNLQTSSKVRNDLVQVGQYGTGFLTTHKFGLKFDLSGSLELCGGTKFLDFDRLTFDRSPVDKQKMIDNLKTQEARIIDMCKNPENLKNLKDKPADFTVFRYRQECEVERERAAEALKQALDLAPYVMALNDLVNSIRFTDETTGREVLCTRNFKQNLEEHDLYTYSVVETHIHRNFDDDNLPSREYNYQVYMLESTQKEESTGQSLATVILPLMKNEVDGEEKVCAFRFKDNKPNFFIHLPLLGTEKWGVNFLFHSPAFTCADESRSALRFVGNGQNNDEQAERNCGILDHAERMIFSFVGEHLDGIDDSRKMFSFVNIDTKNNDSRKEAFFKAKKESWVEQMKNFNLVRSSLEEKTYVKPEKVYVLCREMAEEGERNPEFLDAVYNILKTEYPDSLPAKEDLVFWSKRMMEWYDCDTDSNVFFSVDEIVDLIAKSKDSSVSILGKANILEFDKFLAAHGYLSYFENKAIVPNEAGILKKKGELSSPVDFSKTARAVISVLLPDDYATFVDKDFCKLTQFRQFTEDDFSAKLSVAISKLQEGQKTDRDKFRRYTVSQSYWDRVDNPKSAFIPEEKVAALIKFASMAIKSESASSEAKILGLVKEFHGFSEEVPDTLQGVDARSALRTLIGDAMYRFSVNPPVEKSQWSQKTVEAIYGYADFRSMLRDYKVYQNQKDEYRYAEQLRKEDDIPERLKELYDIIVLDGGDGSIKTSLLKKEYEDCFEGEGGCKGSELSSEVFKVISERREGEEKSYPDISCYKHKKEVLEIIRRIDESEEGQLWATLFPTIKNDRATIMMSIIDDDEKKDSIFKIMQEEDSRKLKALAEITEKVKNPDTLQAIVDVVNAHPAILAIAVKMNEELKENERQFNFKYAIGKIVEDELRSSISSELSCGFRASDEQDGQDIVIRYKGEPKYYLECKAKWSFTDPAHMSSRQMKKAVREKDRYALCCVDCTRDTGAEIAMDATRDEVMNSRDEILAHTYVHTDIGDLLSSAVSPVVKEEDSYDGDESRIRVRGDFSSDIPKKAFVRGIPFRDFLDSLLSTVSGLVSSENNG